MKKIVAAALALIMILALTACAPNVDELSANYDIFQDKYNALVDTAETSGWINDDSVYENMQIIADSVNQYADVIENPSKYTQEQVDALNEKVIELIDWADDCAVAFEEPYEG